MRLNASHCLLLTLLQRPCRMLVTTPRLDDDSNISPKKQTDLPPGPPSTLRPSATLGSGGNNGKPTSFFRADFAPENHTFKSSHDDNTVFICPHCQNQASRLCACLDDFITATHLLQPPTSSTAPNVARCMGRPASCSSRRSRPPPSQRPSAAWVARAPPWPPRPSPPCS